MVLWSIHWFQWLYLCIVFNITLLCSTICLMIFLTFCDLKNDCLHFILCSMIFCFDWFSMIFDNVLLFSDCLWSDYGGLRLPYCCLGCAYMLSCCCLRLISVFWLVGFYSSVWMWATWRWPNSVLQPSHILWWGEEQP